MASANSSQPSLASLSREELDTLIATESRRQELVSVVKQSFLSPDVLCGSFLASDDADPATFMLDVPRIQQVYNKLAQLEDAAVVSAFFEAVAVLLATTDVKALRPAGSTHSVTMRQFVLILCCPFLQEDPFSPVLENLLQTLSRIPPAPRDALQTCFSHFPSELLQQIVITVQQYITLRIMNQIDDEQYKLNFDGHLNAALSVLEILYKASIAVHPRLLPLKEFRNDGVNDNFDLETDALIWIGHMPYLMRPNSFSFTSFPFVLDTSIKTKYMEIDRRRRRARQPRSLMELMNGRPTLVLNIRREHIVRDAIMQISSALTSDPENLQKTLHVKFAGEEAVDEGGVQKEFFQLLLRELFDPKYGMFVVYEDVHLYWFNDASLEAPDEFRLLGILLGLAVVNVIILDLHFPGAVYKKLMNVPVGLEDLEQLDPELARGLRQLLEYDGDDVEEVFERTFTIEKQVFGQVVTYELCEGGKEKKLTNDNRQEYVDCYVDFVLNKSVEKQFAAFSEGFHIVADRSDAYRMIDSSELETVLCGVTNLDFDALEKQTKYDGGYTENHQTIKWFWEIVKDFTEDEKKRLLAFTTGTDRAPVGGLSKLSFIIARQPNSDRLPTAHTCFNALILPDYDSREKLEERLRKAIMHAEGFGML